MNSPILRRVCALVLGLFTLALHAQTFPTAQYEPLTKDKNTLRLLNGTIKIKSGDTVTIESGASLVIASGGTINAAVGSTVTGFGSGGGGGSGDLLSTNNLSDVANAATARSNLGLAIGTNVQSYDADLTTYAGITPSANIQTFLSAADYAAMRAQLGLTIGTNVQAYDADLTTYAGITPSANVQSFLGAADYSAIRTQLGLVIGTNVQAFDADLSALAALSGTNTIYYRSGANTWTAVTIGSGLSFTTGTLTASGGGGGDLLAANNLSDLANAGTARTNLGLAIGTNVQAFDSDLTTWAGVTPGTGVATFLATPSGSNLASALTTALPASKGGTGLTALSANIVSFLGAADYAAIRTQLALTIGTNVQAYDADLTTYAGITPSANVQSLLGAADYAAIRTQLALTIGTNVQAYDADLTTYAGITPSANVQTLLGASNFSAFRTSLGVAIGTDVQAYDADLTTWAGVTPGSGVATFLATPSGANLAAALTNETGTGVPMFNSDPLLLTPNAAMGALAVDVTKRVNTKSVSADSTLTFSATPTAGFTFGLTLTNSDSAAHTITIPSSYSLTRNATLTSFTIPALSSLELSWRYDGSTYFLAGEAYTINDLSTVAIATGDYLPFYDVSGAVDGKATAASLLALGIDDTAYDATTWNGVTTRAPSMNAVRDKFESLSAGGGDMFSTLVNTEVSITTTATATISKMHVCSGTSANYTVTLPAVSGNTGKFLGIRISSACTKLITIDGASSETIDGALTRVMWANETAVLHCDGTTWTKVAGKSVPMTAEMTMGSSQNLSDGVETVLTMDTSVSSSPAGLVNTGSSRFDVLRPGLYNVDATLSIGPRGLAGVTFIKIFVTSTQKRALGSDQRSGAYFQLAVTGTGIAAAAGDTITTKGLVYGGGTETIGGGSMTVTEVPSW